QARLVFAGAESPHLPARALGVALFAWLPLCVIELLTRHQADVQVTFFQDIASYVRFLVVIPVLILAEGAVSRRTRMVATYFAMSGLVRAEEAPRFVAAVHATRKRAESVLAEAILLALACVAIWFSVRALTHDGVVFWYEAPDASGERLTFAGWWYAYVASPIVMFLFLRWGWRYLVWWMFLHRVSKLDLQIVGTHPDRAGGLGFVTIGHNAFTMCTFAMSAVLAAAAANRILYQGVALKEYQSVIIGIVVVQIVLGLIPLLVFTRRLVMAKRRGLLQYGELGSHYVQLFHRKWVEKEDPQDEPLLGTGDIQSLADIGGSFERLQTMSAVPFDRRTVMVFAAAAAVPMLPLLLIVMPLRDMVRLLVKAMI
ncbi:MAG TPA: hypothetical protein VFU38_04175, partial [Candidatus Krumholzibacteria bacterium]|nr:hypothetical protein [Candidatus Krumholzibacteria bacterium]